MRHVFIYLKKLCYFLIDISYKSSCDALPQLLKSNLLSLTNREFLRVKVIPFFFNCEDSRFVRSICKLQDLIYINCFKTNKFNKEARLVVVVAIFLGVILRSLQ